MPPAPNGRRMLRIEAKNAQTPIEQKPDWIRTTAKNGPEYQEMKNRVSGASLHTVCQEANCPNMFECWESREATFLIGGGKCTRRCDFCNIATGKPEALDKDEPRRVAESVREMGLRYATVTGVARDDLADGASWLYAETCRQIHELNPGTGVELLVDDFRGDGSAAEAVFEAKPEVFAHNIETVPRIFKRIRPAFRYERSLEMINAAREAGMVTKSNLILGMGEQREEIIDAMHDLNESGCDILTITQYLRPSPMHHPIDRWVKPEEFVELSNIAHEMGFAGVMAGPLVRSSYRAGTLYARALKARGEQLPEHLAALGEGNDTMLQEASSVLEKFGQSKNAEVAAFKPRLARRADERRQRTKAG
ncbi:lipoyl synthase [Corynebacterium sp. TAE3-ERU12]|uniref:lipoyl synthase n=1 Tax=Corynebacterium sp. TAE3-ERU12 TaxID=2849491 RepID=UPI001C45886C|nr:lipoyl synthase [Corynebacterium sp. TAE3-ERU12]MBV7295834.1 lipoyl synthase [Corynebacterium sp. TAE3-ERU12]